jgi:hypothetical protein
MAGTEASQKEAPISVAIEEDMQPTTVSLSSPCDRIDLTESQEQNGAKESPEDKLVVRTVTKLTDVEKVVLNGISSIEFISGPGGATVVTSNDKKSAKKVPEKQADTGKDDDKPKDEKKKESKKKTYLLKVRWVFQEVDEDGKVIRTVKRDEQEMDDEEDQVPILESITVKSKAIAYGYEVSDRTYVKILSPMIVDALRFVVKYSSVSLDGNTISLEAPFRLLHNHWDELEYFMKHHPSTHSEQYIEECNSHIEFMFKWLKESEGGKWHSIEKARWNRNPPTATFKNLWMLLRVGDIIMVKKNEEIAPYALHHIYGGIMDNRKTEPYTLLLWNLDFDGEFFGRSLISEEIKQFDGEAEITSLKTYPAKYHENWEKVEKQFIERQVYRCCKEEALTSRSCRGRRFVKTVKNYTFAEYTGRTVQGPKREVRSIICIFGSVFSLCAVQKRANHGRLRF